MNQTNHKKPLQEEPGENRLVFQALGSVLFLESEAQKFNINDPKAELLWQAANLLRQLHGLGDGDIEH